LYVEISPSGGRWWRFKYRINGKEKRLSLGVYLDVSLKAARDRLDEVRRRLAAGVDPAEERKGSAATSTDPLSSNTFELIAREWFSGSSNAGVTRRRTALCRIAAVCFDMPSQVGAQIATSRAIWLAPAPVVERHHASIVEPKAVGALLRAIDSYEGSFVTRCALRLAPLVFVRPGELRMTEWYEATGAVASLI
jgi:integrase